MEEFGMEEFNNELQGFQIQMPGSGGSTVPFSDNDAMLKMVRKQYPDWKNQGKVTSIPIARVPKLFLHNLQMEEPLQKIFKSTQKGDGAEKQLYNLFMRGDFSNQPGTLVFPNFDASQIFQTQVAKVEIDMILIHQTKGVFIFNVKNVGGKSATVSKMKDDILKHRNLVQMLFKFQNTVEETSIAIHSVVCNFFDASSKFKCLADATKDPDAKTIILNKHQLNPEIFSSEWENALNAINTKSTLRSSKQLLDVLVARLIALSSMESSLALIHEQLDSGYLQSVAEKKHLETQMKPCGHNENSTKTIVQQSKTKNKKGRNKYILWTKDQMQVISKVYEHFAAPSERTLRLLVTGCKGSGKTMLLIFFAKLLDQMLQSKGQHSYGQVLVCDGSFNCLVLMEIIQQQLASTNADVFRFPMNGREFDICRGLQLPEFREIFNGFKQKLDKATVLLCDEFQLESHKEIVGSLRSDQHCILFTSTTYCDLEPSFNKIHLDASLRSTCSIANFATKWRTLSYAVEFNCVPAHNFEGERVDIRVIEKLHMDHLEYPNFAAQSARQIVVISEQSKDLKILPVLCFMSSQLREMLFSTFKILFPDHLCINRALSRFHQQVVGEVETKQSGKEGPPITLFDARDIDGCEFATVVILVSFMHLRDVDTFLDTHFFKAVTRACIKLTFIVSDLQLFDCLELNEKLPAKSEECCLTKKQNSIFHGHLLEVVQKAVDKPCHLFVGRKPDFPVFFKKQNHQRTDIPKIEGLSEYVCEQSCLLHIEDVFEEQSLEALRVFGVEIINIFPENASCFLQHEFYDCTCKLIETFSKRNGYCFSVNALLYPKHHLMGMLFSLLKFLTSISHDGDITNLKSIENAKTPTRTDTVISWKKWKAKADDFFRVGNNDQPMMAYTPALYELEKNLKNSLEVNNINAACEIFQETAKIFTNISLVFLKSSDSQKISRGSVNSAFARFNSLFSKNDFPDLDLFTLLIMKAMISALVASEFNVCWSRSYERLRSAIQKLKKHCCQFLESEGVSQQKTDDSQIKQLISKDKEFAKTEVFWDASNIKDQSGSADIALKLECFSASVKEYQSKLQSANSDELLQLRKTISNAARDLEVSSRNIKTRVNSANANSFDVMRALLQQVKICFTHAIQFGVYAIRWDPIDVRNYKSLLESLNWFEQMVEQLQNGSQRIAEREYLEYIARMIASQE